VTLDRRERSKRFGCVRDIGESRIDVVYTKAYQRKLEILKGTEAMTAAATERPASRGPRRERGTINLRVSERTRQLIDTAAAVVGKSRTEFMLDSARRHAIDVVLDQRLFVLDAEQYDAFVRVLDNPPPAGAQLKALMKKRPLWEK
jgi:uncharacterized protein (DUF1778 family)